MVTEEFITSFDGTRIFTETLGTGDIPVLLCDGLGCDGFIWQHLTRALSERCRFYHFHYRGHGVSGEPAVENATTVRDLRSDLLAVMDHYQLDQALLLGHSMGVQVILDFAIQYPERTMGLVPMCGSYGHPLDTFHNTDVGGKVLPYLRKLTNFSPKLAQMFWSKTLTTEAAYQIAVNLEVNGKVLRREEFGPYFQHLAAMNVRVFLGVVEGLMDHCTESQLPNVSVPTLVVGGQHDTFTPGWLSERMVELLPDAELLMIPGGSHVAPIEIPELLHLRLKKFINARIAPQISEKAPKSQKEKSMGKTVGAQSKAKTKASKQKAAKVSGDVAGKNKKSTKGISLAKNKKDGKKGSKKGSKKDAAAQFLGVWDATVREAELEAKAENKSQNGKNTAGKKKATGKKKSAAKKNESPKKKTAPKKSKKSSGKEKKPKKPAKPKSKNRARA